ncbi:MAG: DUF3078 domain-containing protein [Bacteroidota bacterium]
MRPIFLSVLLCAAASGQEADTLRADDGWRSSLVASLAGSQSTFSNWQEGGVDALALTSSIDGAFDRVFGNVLTTQQLRLALGILQQDTLETRKALDVIRYVVTAERSSDNPLRPAGSFSLRTQFAPGFDYDPGADEYPSLTVVPGEELKVSDAFSPLILSQTVGVAYRPGGGFVARAGLGAKETIVSIERLRPVYGNELDESIRFEAGLDAEVALDREVLPNVTLRSTLAAFQAFDQFGETPDLRFENVLLMKVNEVLNVTLNADALFDADVSDDLQLRQVLAVGLSLALIE